MRKVGTDRDLLVQSLEIFERLGDQLGQAKILYQLGILAQLQGDFSEARKLYTQSLEIEEQPVDRLGQAQTLGQWGLLAYEQRDFERALTYTIQAFILFDTFHSPSLDRSQRMLAKIHDHLDEATFMTHWRTIAGDRPLPLLSDEEPNRQLRQIVIDFIQVPTWDESKHILESHPELLQPEVDTVLQALAAQQKQEGTPKVIEEYRLLLANCKDKGVEGAFTALLDRPKPGYAFTTELNLLCKEVTTTLRAKNAGQRETLATRIENMLQGDLPMGGVSGFLKILIVWLRGQDTQTLEEKLQPPFRDKYAQMVTEVEQEEMEANEVIDRRMAQMFSNLVTWPTSAKPTKKYDVPYNWEL